jgi:hypothetical protein
MAYYLGKDVELVWSTENSSRGVNVGAGGDIEPLATVNPVSGAVALASPNFQDNAMADLTGLDLSIGATDEDVAFLGVRTPLKAEVHKETTVTLTKKKGNKVFDVMFASGARWGVNSSNALYDGLSQPDTDFGYRLFIILKNGEETFVVRSAQMNSHTVTLNADGTQEETMEFISSVQPKIYPASNSSGINTGVSAAEL